MKEAYKYDILENHNDYELSISRNNAEEIKSDPFGLGAPISNVKGLARVSLERNLSDYAQELVCHYAKFECDQYNLSLNKLPEDEQGQLARLYIESIDREIEYACYGADESINSDYLCALLAMLKDDCHETREAFAEVTRKNIILYYEKSLQEVLNQACNDYYNNMMNEEDYHAHQDQDDGDVVWGKF